MKEGKAREEVEASENRMLIKLLVHKRRLVCYSMINRI